jgi:Tudor domain
VTNAVSPNEFSCQLMSNKLELELLMKNMKEYYLLEEVDKPLSTDDITPGSLVAVKYSVDASWYRATVLSVNSETDIKILLVDYGMQGSVAVGDIRCLKDRFTSVPAMSFMCALEAFNDSSDQAVEKFQQLVVNRQLVAQVVSQCAVSDVTYHREVYHQAV